MSFFLIDKNRYCPALLQGFFVTDQFHGHPYKIHSKDDKDMKLLRGTENENESDSESESESESDDKNEVDGLQESFIDVTGQPTKHPSLNKSIRKGVGKEEHNSQIRIGFFSRFFHSHHYVGHLVQVIKLFISLIKSHTFLLVFFFNNS